MNTNHIIVTGGLGFIGSAIAEYYLSKDYEVTIVDSQVSNVVEPEYISYKYPSAKHIHSTVCDYFTNNRKIPACDLIIHTASLVGPSRLLSYGGVVGRETVSDTGNIIETCLRLGSRLIYFSSAEIYGKSGTLRENMEVRVPAYYNTRIEYALAKLTSEAMIVNSRSDGLRAVIIRPFNVVGPRQSRAGGFVLPTFVQQALGNKPVTVFGTGKQERAFTGVGDIADFVANYLLKNKFEEVPIINIGNPKNRVSIEELAFQTVDLLNSRSNVIKVHPSTIYGPDYQECESFKKIPDIAVANSLGWVPKRSLSDLILETATYYRNHRDTGGHDARS